MKLWISSSLNIAINLILSLKDDIKRFDLLRHAYAMAYISLLSLIPSLAAIFAVLSLFSPLISQDSNLVNLLKDFVLEHLASASGEQAVQYIEMFIANLDIKKIGITGFAGTLITLILLLKHIEVALNKIFQVHRPRNLVTRFVNFWTFLTLGSFSLTLFIATVSTYTSNGTMGYAPQILGNLANNLILFVMFSLIYKLVPNCYVSTVWALAGGAFATTLLAIAASLLKAYIVLFSNYKAVYGAALAALPIFLLWLYVIWIIVLLGALFCWRMQNRSILNQESKDKTLEPSSPYKRAKIRSELPFAILNLCIESFNTGKGQGINKEMLATKLNVPIYWIEEFIALLEDKNLIVIDRNDYQNPTIFPKRPSDALPKVELQNILEEENKEV